MINRLYINLQESFFDILIVVLTLDLRHAWIKVQLTQFST